MASSDRKAKHDQRRHDFGSIHRRLPNSAKHSIIQERGDFSHRASLPSALLPGYPVTLTKPPWGFDAEIEVQRAADRLHPDRGCGSLPARRYDLLPSRSRSAGLATGLNGPLSSKVNTTGYLPTASWPDDYVGGKIASGRIQPFSQPSRSAVSMAAFGALPPLIARSANVQDSVESLPFDDNSFDMALAINSMQYWPQAVAGLPLGP
jgi:hypothetical protein